MKYNEIIWKIGGKMKFEIIFSICTRPGSNTRSEGQENIQIGISEIHAPGFELMRGRSKKRSKIKFKNTYARNRTHVRPGK